MFKIDPTNKRRCCHDCILPEERRCDRRRRTSALSKKKDTPPPLYARIRFWNANECFGSSEALRFYCYRTRQLEAQNKLVRFGFLEKYFQRVRLEWSIPTVVDYFVYLSKRHLIILNKQTEASRSALLAAYVENVVDGKRNVAGKQKARIDKTVS